MITSTSALENMIAPEDLLSHKHQIFKLKVDAHDSLKMMLFQ